VRKERAASMVSESENSLAQRIAGENG
jgi:hypothetical protein